METRLATAIGYLASYNVDVSQRTTRALPLIEQFLLWFDVGAIVNVRVALSSGCSVWFFFWLTDVCSCFSWDFSRRSFGSL